MKGLVFVSELEALVESMEVLFDRIENNPKTVGFKELDKLLIEAGFTKRQSEKGSSHSYYTKEDKTISAPFKKPFISQEYILDAIELIVGYWRASVTQEDDDEKKTFEYYMSLAYRAIARRSPEGGYVAKIVDLPGCLTQGDTLEDALQMIEDAKAGWIDLALQNGTDVPELFDENISIDPCLGLNPLS